MKTRGMAMATLILGMDFFVPAARADEGGDWGAGLQFITIGLGDLNLYEYGLGVEAQNRRWFSENRGWAVSFGVARWEADSANLEWKAPTHGALWLFPVGGSFLVRSSPSDSRRFVLEAGVRYVWTDSDLRFKPGDSPERPVRLEDGMVGVIGLDLEQTRGATILFAGIAYQMDLLDGQVTRWDGEKKDHHLEAASLRFGFRRPF